MGKKSTRKLAKAYEPLPIDVSQNLEPDPAPPVPVAPVAVAPVTGLTPSVTGLTPSYVPAMIPMTTMPPPPQWAAAPSASFGYSNTLGTTQLPTTARYGAAAPYVGPSTIV